MSHSTVLVIGPTTEDELATALAPFDDKQEVEPYVRETKAQQIADRRQLHAQAAEDLRKYEARQAPYDRPVVNVRHLAWIQTEAPAEAALDDDELWALILERESGTERDENGDVWSTYNPKSRWDWYQIGGRWDGGLVLNQRPADHDALRVPGDRYPVTQIAEERLHPRDTWHVNHTPRLALLDLDETEPTFAVLTPDGQWHERGHMGWWGVVRDGVEPGVWATRWRELVAQHAEQPAYLVDVHI